MHLFIGEHRAFAFHTPMIVMQPSIGCKGAVAGNKPADRICTDRGPYGTGGFGAAGGLCERAICLGFAGWNLKQRAPDLPAERRAIQGHGQGLAICENIARHLFRGRVIDRNGRFWVARGKVSERVGFISALMFKSGAFWRVIVNEPKRNQAPRTN